MPRSYPFSIVDVFAEKQFSGNQLAILHNASDLTDEQMQTIAMEMNFSETTFVTKHKQGWASVRIFTPSYELPFAGHPTIGTAWTLTHGKSNITLELAAGDVDVNFNNGISWMTPPSATFTGSLEAEQIANLLSLNVDDIGDSNNYLPISVGTLGPAFVIVPVKSLEALKRSKPSSNFVEQVKQLGYDIHSMFLFTSESYNPTSDYATRMYFDSNGVREDAATGSANSLFANYLRRQYGNIGELIVEQGFEINRPSRIYLSIDEQIKIGGKVQMVVNGYLDIN